MSFSFPPSHLAPLLTLLMLLAAVVAGASPTVDLGTAGDFAILSKSGVTTTGTTSVFGDMGTSPIAATALTGFALTLDASTQFSTSSLVTGQIFAANYAVPTPAKMTTAVSDMQTAYVDAAGRPHPDHVELHTGNLSYQTLSPGLYKWSTTVSIPTASSTLTFDGDANDVWIMQIAGTFDAASSSRMVLTGGAKASNIFWVIAGATTFGTYSHVEGVFLAKTNIVFQTGSSGNGAFLAQTAVTLDAATIGEQTYSYSYSYPPQQGQQGQGQQGQGQQGQGPQGAAHGAAPGVDADDDEETDGAGFAVLAAGFAVKAGSVSVVAVTLTAMLI